MRYTVRLNYSASFLIRGALLCIFCIVGAIVLLFGYTHAQAATIVVGSGCSLVDAISSANNDSSVGGCTTGNLTDTITLSDSLYTFATANNNFAGNNALPPIT